VQHALASSPRSERVRHELGATAFVLAPVRAGYRNGDIAIVTIRLRVSRAALSESPEAVGKDSLGDWVRGDRCCGAPIVLGQAVAIQWLWGLIRLCVGGELAMRRQSDCTADLPRRRTRRDQRLALASVPSPRGEAGCARDIDDCLRAGLTCALGSTCHTAFLNIGRHAEVRARYSPGRLTTPKPPTHWPSPPDHSAQNPT